MPKVFGVLVLIVAVVSLIFISRSPSFRGILAPPGSGGVATTTEEIEEPILPPAPPSEVLPPPVPEPAPPISPAIDPAEIPAGFTLSQLSPYFHKVRFSNLWPAPPEGGILAVSLVSYLEEKKTVDITGWRIQGNRGGQVIGRGVAAYPISGLPVESDIYLSAGDVVNMHSGVSPLGVNIKINKCMGYLENHYVFEPQLGVGCPWLDPPPATFSGECQDYINSLWGCTEPQNNPPVPFGEDACYAYLRDVNYRGCVERHYQDPDFTRQDWRIWIGSDNRFLDYRHDRVLLFDTRGLLVDLTTY